MRDSTWDAVLTDSTALQRGIFVCFARLPDSGTERVLLAVEDDWREDDDAVPGGAAAEGMTGCLDGQQLRGIVDNLRQQDPSAGPEWLRRAVAYYWSNDAFLDLAELGR